MVSRCLQNSRYAPAAYRIVRYPYPIFEQVPFAGRVGLFVLSAVVMALSTATLKWLYGRVNYSDISTLNTPLENENTPVSKTVLVGYVQVAC